MLVMPREWEQSESFLSALDETLGIAPARGRYYPGCDDRMDQFESNYPKAVTISGNDTSTRRLVKRFQSDDDKSFAENVEIFAPVLGVTMIDGKDAEGFLRAAIAYCNDSLHGTLGANIIIHPATRKAMADRWDDIISELRYGCIAINAWTGLGFLAIQTPWGAYPGHTLQDVQSGIGFVHNSYMFGRPERTVVEAPFRPFPRNLLHGSATLLPKPPWFVTNKKARILGKLLTRFQHRPSLLKVPRIFLNAMLG